MKKNSRAFMLVETLIVSISISGILIFLYLQFTNVNNSYVKTYSYNTIEGLYKAADIKENIIYNGKDKIFDDINTNKFVDLSNCSSTYYNNTAYCNKLKEIANVKTVIITTGNLDNLKNKLTSGTNMTTYSETMRDFVNKIENYSNGYQIIVEYNDNTIAAVKMER